MPNSKQPCQGNHKATTRQVTAKAWTSQPYPAYKDSGVEWLGEVPEHWQVQRLKRICRLAYGDALASISRNAGTVPVMGSNGQVGFHNSANTLAPCIVVGRKGSFGKVNYSADSVFAIDTTFFIDNRHSSAHLRWLYYLLGWLELDGATKDSAIPGLDREDAYQKCAAVPPLPEQGAIAHFLDHATQRIQHHIQAKQKLIKLLEEKKQVIIHQAVTGQINVQTGQPYSTYKDSGVEWLRRVPEHWETGMVKRGYDIKLGKMLQIKPNNANDIEVSYLKAKDVQWFSVQLISGVKMWASPEDIEQLSVSSGDLLVCEGGEGGRCGILTSAVNGHIIQNSLHRVRSRDGNSNVFLQYTMRAIAETGWFVALNNKATIAHFTCEKFGALRIPFPGPLEQSAIADFLTHTNHRISRHRAAVKREIDLLHEYRTRLIADVVTGKLDMREVAAHLPKGDPLPPDSNCQDGTDLADPRRSPHP